LRCGEEEFDVPQAVEDAGRTASGVGLESPPDHGGGVRGAKFPRLGAGASVQRRLGVVGNDEFLESAES